MADAATEFFGQANSFNASMGDVVGSAAVALVKADVMAKQANAGFIETLLVGPDGKPRPNVTVTDTFNFGGKEAVQFEISEPLFVLADLTSFMPQTATISLDMDVSAQANDSSSYKAEMSASGEGSVGWGPFKASVKISATASTSGSKSRSSDYRSKTHCDLTMGRNPEPEGVQRLNDLLTTIGDIAKQMVLAEARDAAQTAAQEKGLVPASGSDSGGGGGGGNNNEEEVNVNINT